MGAQKLARLACGPFGYYVNFGWGFRGPVAPIEPDDDSYFAKARSMSPRPGGSPISLRAKSLRSVLATVYPESCSTLNSRGGAAKRIPDPPPRSPCPRRPNEKAPGYGIPFQVSGAICPRSRRGKMRLGGVAREWTGPQNISRRSITKLFDWYVGKSWVFVEGPAWAVAAGGWKH